VSGDELTRQEPFKAVRVPHSMPLGAVALAARASTNQTSILGRTVIRAPINGVIRAGRCSLVSACSPPCRSCQSYRSISCTSTRTSRKLQSPRFQRAERRAQVRPVYGKMVYHCVIEGFDGGTGAAFALIPRRTQPATGSKLCNAYRCGIRLNPDELAAIRCASASMDARSDLNSKS